MAIEQINASGTNLPTPCAPAELDASKVIVTPAKVLKPVPAAESLVFGETKTDHMLIVNYNPVEGWSVPEIKPYGPLSVDPTSSCFHYCPNVFEGMKAYIGPDGEARLFRPEMNMARFARSAERVALPPFDTSAVLTLIKLLIQIETRWIPNKPGYSLYIRPTIIGTREGLGLAASDSACLYVVLTPTGPYFSSVPKGISLLAVGESVRAWPGGTGSHKVGLNYAPAFLPQRIAAKQGYEQILWLLPVGNEERVTEVGAMNFFIVVRRDDGDLDLITPELDGTILPGITRDSTLALAEAHTSGKYRLPGVPATMKIYTHEQAMTMAEIARYCEEDRLLESFGVGTAVVVAPVSRIGWKGRDLVLPSHEGGLGPVGNGLLKNLLDVQSGKKDFEGWSTLCV